jgi:TIR domain
VPAEIAGVAHIHFAFFDRQCTSHCAARLARWRGLGRSFLDLDPERGIAAGERWERALNEAARRCEAALFLISKAWLASRWCTNELNLARRLNKRLFGILIEEGLAVGDLPADVTSKSQVIKLAAGSDHKQFPVTLPVTGELATPTFSREGLARLKSVPAWQRVGSHGCQDPGPEG